MIKFYFKNWFIYLRYSIIILIFAVVGILVSALSISIGTYIISNDRVNYITNNASLVSKITTDIFNYYFSDLKTFLNSLCNSDGIKEIIIDDIGLSNNDVIDFSNRLYIVNIISIVLMLLIIYIGYLFTASKIRKKMCPISLRRYIIVFIIRKILDLILIQSSIFYLNNMGLYSLVITIVVLILNIFISLFIAYIAQHKKKDKLKIYNIVNPKTIFLSLLSTILLLVFLFILYLLSLKYFQPLFLIFVLPIFLYTLIITTLVPEAFVKKFKEI